MSWNIDLYIGMLSLTHGISTDNSELQVRQLCTRHVTGNQELHQQSLSLPFVDHVNMSLWTLVYGGAARSMHGKSTGGFLCRLTSARREPLKKRGVCLQLEDVGSTFYAEGGSPLQGLTKDMIQILHLAMTMQ